MSKYVRTRGRLVKILKFLFFIVDSDCIISKRRQKWSHCTSGLSYLNSYLFLHYQTVILSLKYSSILKSFLSSSLLEISFKRRTGTVIYYMYNNLEINWWKSSPVIGISFLSLYSVQSNVPMCPRSCFHQGISFPTLSLPTGWS